MKASLEISGLTETIDGLGEFKRSLMPELEQEMKISVLPLKAAMQEYPPAAPGSDYVRTYAYQQSVDVVAKLNGSTIDVIAKASDVQHWLRGEADGSYSGAMIHRGRWKSMVDILQQYLPVVFTHLQRRIERLIGRIFPNG